MTDLHKGKEVKELTVEELLALRTEIDQALPAAHLRDLDLESELVIQFLQVKSLQNKTMDDSSTAANQKAQVANSCASTLAQLIKMQTEFYSAERMKTIEQTLIRVLQNHPGLSEAFLKDYEEALGG